MSIKLMTVAWGLDNVSHTQKLLLLALCDSANDDGVCWPSVSVLMKKCSLSDRGVQKCMNDLERLGFLERDIRSGKRTMYKVTPERCSPPNDVRPEPHAPTPEPRSPRNINKHKDINISRASEVEILALFGVVGELAEDFIAMRKSKRVPITKTAMQGFAREATKARLSVAEAVRLSIERGWQGFKADWVVGQVSGGNHASGRTVSGNGRADRNRQINDRLDEIIEAEFGSPLDGGAVC